jgi:hypothetical protein
MVDPGTAILIASAIAASAKGAGDLYGSKSQEKQAKRRAKETKRETQASLLDEAMNRNAELQAHRMSSRNKLGKSKVRASQETSDLVRGALNI